MNISLFLLDLLEIAMFLFQATVIEHLTNNIKVVKITLNTALFLLLLTYSKPKIARGYLN